MTSTAWLGEPGLMTALAEADLEVEGRLSGASNATLRCRADVDGRALHVVVKPVAGERPLWDFPQWTLTRREVAAYELSEALGWHLVPPTVWREDGPGGPGMCQLWIDEDLDLSMVGVVAPGGTPDGWRTVLQAEDGEGRPVLLVHSDTEALRRLAVLDVLANNADRKGGHVITDSDGRVWGIDHGVTFAVEDKLRTVLWGWVGEEVPPEVMSDVDRLHGLLATTFDPVDRWLGEEEREALRERVRHLLDHPVLPEPSGHWPAIPWPVF